MPGVGNLCFWLNAKESQNISAWVCLLLSGPPKMMAFLFGFPSKSGNNGCRKGTPPRCEPSIGLDARWAHIFFRKCASIQPPNPVDRVLPFFWVGLKRNGEAPSDLPAC